jgi:hypothetical protein
MSFASAGQFTLTAKDNGDSSLGPASTSVTVNVTAPTILIGGSTPSATALTVSPATEPLGTPITLTASVKITAGMAAQSGQVKFCNAAATVCAGSAMLGTAQVTIQGTATQKIVLPIGSYAVKAIYVGNSLLLGSTSSSLQLTGPYFRFALLVEGDDGATSAANLLTLRLSVHLIADPPDAAPWLTFENTARF